MKIDDREVTAEILDESAKGFSVALDGSPDCDIGQTLLLEIGSGWTEVRVMNLRLQKSVDPEEPEGPLSETWTRLGLMRLRDVDASEAEPEQPVRLSWADLRTLIHPFTPLVRLFTGVAGLILGASLAVVVLVWTLEQSVPLDRAISDDAPHTRPVTEESRPRSTRTVKGTSPIAMDPARPLESARPRKSIPEKVTPAAPLGFPFKPGDTKLLALDREQLDQLGRILDEYRAMTGKGVAASPGSSAPSGADDPEIQLGRRGLAILTEKQRGTLMRLLSRPETLLKPEVTKLLALSPGQLRTLRQNFDEYRKTVNRAVPANRGTSAPPTADDPEIQLGRHSLAVLTEKQRGTLMRLLSTTELLQESNTPNQPST